MGQPERGRQAKMWAWWRVLSRLVVVTAMAACASALAPAVGWAGPATHFVVSAPASTTAGNAFSFTVTAADQFGNTDTSYAGTVHFTTTDAGAGASLPADSPLPGGSGTFSATLVTAGSQTITATDAVHSLTGTSNTIAVSAAAATHFTVSAPSSATSGTAFNFTVTAQDQFNNTATGYTGTVVFTSSDGQATLPTNSNLTNGTGTFSATLKTAGTQTITATDQNNSSITGTSNAIAVSAAAATHFMVSAPSSATSGAAFSFTVTAQDQFNNTATGYTGTVQFTSTDGQATLPANSTLTNGTGTFSATLKTAGSQTITATDKNNSSITGTSNTVAVSAAAAAHFTVSAPSSTTSGTAFSFTVTAQDAFNNTATGYAGTVQFTSSDGQATLPANSTLTNGTGTFSATLKTAGTQTITATDKNNSSITGTSNQIAVSSAGATHFAVSAPAAATAGAPFNFTVTAQDQFNNTATGYTGTVQFTSSDGQAVLPANSTLTNGTGTFSATLKTTGAQTITATDKNNSSITGTSNTITVGLKASSNTTLASSQNPSSFGQSVTFTTTVAGGITPTGTVTFKDGATVLGTSTLNASAQASFTTASLSIGTHAITATYSGDPNNFSSTSAVLNQAVNVPADSLKLRALQIEVTKIEAQGSGQAVSGAIDSAIADAFSGGAPVSASDNGVHFSFASDAPPQQTQKTFEERFGQAFSALGYAGDPVVKAPPRAIQKEWFPWADVRGINWNTGLQTGDIRGGQTNGTFGLTRKLSPDVLVGVFGGGEIFDYTSQLLNGRLKGTGWTAGGYFSWRMLPGLRFDLGGGHSELSYDDVAGTAAGSFPGHRWIATAALVGSLKTASGFEVEPSARVYGLWEHEDAYTDSLGVTQADRDFSTGRASAGARVGHAWMWSPTTLIFPYVGGYADYYFNSDNALLPAGAAPFLLPTQFVQGWSARVTSGVGVRFSSGPQFSIGGEVGGLGSNQFTTWTVRGRAAVPF